MIGSFLWWTWTRKDTFWRGKTVRQRLRDFRRRRLQSQKVRQLATAASDGAVAALAACDYIGI